MIAGLPANMRPKITVELTPIAGLPGFCWAWTGALNSKGYGCASINGKVQLTHRIAYEALVGTIAAGLQIDHLCHNKRCCNPAHLEAVTGKVNASRTDRAKKTLCVHGHPLSGGNLVLKKSVGRVIRNCRECTNRSSRAARARAKVSA